MRKAIAALALTVGMLGLAPTTAKADGFGFGFSFGDRHHSGSFGYSDGCSGGYWGGYDGGCRPVVTYDDCYRPCGHWEYRCESYIVTCGFWDRVWVNDCSCGHWETRWVAPVYGTRTVRVWVP